MEILKISSKSNPNSVAGAIAGLVKEENKAEMQAIGAGALNQAIKAICIARGFVAPSGINLVCIPAFTDIEIDGSAGYFVGTMIDGPKIHIKRNAGWFAGDNMTNGELIIEGTAGDGAGQGIYGGTVVVKGDAGSRTGEIMKGGTVIIGGNSGFMTGLLMMGGRLIVLGDVTDDAGESIMRGTIYVLGEVKSLGKNAQIEQSTLEDQKELKTILKKYGFEITDIDYTNFKKFINFFTERNKPTINSYLTQLSNLIEIQRNILFIDNLNYNYFDSANKKSETDNYKKINFNKKRINIEEQKVHNLFNNTTIFNFLNTNSEYNTILNKTFELIMNELKQLKEKNKELLKSNYANDILLINKIKELKEIEKYINSPQIKAFFDITKKKENIVKKMNDKFIKKENKYLIDLYKLNYEMKDLLLLLERNKDYYDKYKEIEQREKINNSENSYMKAHLTNELEKKEKQYKNEIELNNDLNADIIKLEENINELKNKNE